MTSLSDEDREVARRIAAEMPAWTQDQLDELAQIVAGAPRVESRTS